MQLTFLKLFKMHYLQQHLATLILDLVQGQDDLFQSHFGSIGDDKLGQGLDSITSQLVVGQVQASQMVNVEDLDDALHGLISQQVVGETERF